MATGYSEVKEKRYAVELAILERIEKTITDNGLPSSVETLASAFAMVHSGQPKGVSDVKVSNSK